MDIKEVLILLGILVIQVVMIFAAIMWVSFLNAL